MKRRNLLIAVAAILVMFAFVACSESVAPEDRLGTITFDNNTSRAVGTVVTYSNEVENMVWLYKATKLDDGYTTGQTSGFVAVAAPTSATDNGNTTYTAVKGLSGKTLNNNFSYGLWKIELRGYKEENVTASNTGVAINDGKSDKYEYSATIDNFLVDSGANYAKAEIKLGDNPETTIVFDTVNGISFKADNIKADSVFTLEVTDNKGTVTVGTGADDVEKAKGSVTFKNLTYELKDNAVITGEHEMKFVLKQTLSGEGNVTIYAAVYTLKFTVQSGTTTTISGTLVKRDDTGTIQINSIQDVKPLTLSRSIPVENIQITDGVGTASVSSQTTMTVGSMTVTLPVGTVIATKSDSVTENSDTDKTGAADGTIGFVQKESTESDIKVTAGDTVIPFELTLPVATTNSTELVTVKNFIGKNLTITEIWHVNAKLDPEPSETKPTDNKEGYYYNSETGYLTLYVFHASEFNIVTKTPVAEVNGTKYYSLSEAIGAVSEKGTVTLLSSVTLTKDITPSKSFTLDMSGKTVTPDGKAIKVEAGTVTVEGSVDVNQAEFVAGVNASAYGINGTYSPRVAQVGDKYYASLESAIEAAGENSTVKLLRDTTLTETVTASESITLDLDSKAVNVSGGACVIVGVGTTLTVTKKAESQADFVVGIAGENGTYTAGVARIGIVCYATFEAAVEAAEDAEIVLLQDVTYSEGDIDKNLTIDFNNCKMTLTAELSIKKSSSDNASCPKVTFKNGKLEGENLINTSPVISVNEGTLDIQNMKINLVSKNEFGIYVDASFDTAEVSNLSIANSVISVEGGNNNVSQGAILVGNNDGMYYGNVNITNSTITVSGGANLYGIYASRSDACNTFNFVIENTDVTGVKGGLIVWAKSDQAISISNSTFTGEKYGAYFDGGKVAITKSELEAQYGLFVYGNENNTSITLSDVKLKSSSDMRLILTANSSSSIEVDGRLSSDSVKKYVIQKGNTVAGTGEFSEKLTISNAE